MYFGELFELKLYYCQNKRKNFGAVFPKYNPQQRLKYAIIRYTFNAIINLRYNILENYSKNNFCWLFCNSVINI